MRDAAGAEREHLADERERLADERDTLADARERLADRHEAMVQRREGQARQRGWSDAHGDEQAELARAAVRRAEAALRRAEDNLRRTRLAADRMTARTQRRAADSERLAAAAELSASTDSDERAWLTDRRDFVAVERERLADERERLADEREETGDRRERLDDAREREALERERRLDRRLPVDRHVDRGQYRPEREPGQPTERRAGGAAQRHRAAATRPVAGQQHRDPPTPGGPPPYGAMLLRSFAELAAQMFGSDGLTDALPRILKFAVETMAGCDWASVTLVRHGQVTDTLSTGPVAAELDDLQFRSGLGPALEAMGTGPAVYVPDLAGSRQWPLLAATAADRGAATALCHGLFVHHPAQWSAVGALSLYGGTPDAFSHADQDFAVILAAYVAVAVATSYQRDDLDRQEAALHRGLSTRDVIGQAKGILMERRRLSAGDAFDVLRRASQRHNRRVVDVAQHLADTGELPA